MHKQVPIKDAINLAVQVYRKAGNQYNKENVYEYKNTEDGPLEQITTKSNKQILKELFDKDQLVIDPKCNDMVEDIYNHYQGLVFKVLSDTASDFVERIYKIVTKEMVERKDLGFVAPLPALYEQEMARDLFIEEVSQSQHLGTPGTKMNTRAILHEARYIRTRDFHVYTFISDGNLISHFSQKGITEWGAIPKLREGNEYNITFKVKRHGHSKFYNCNDTLVNYLKISD